jgi:hypothetical protein
MDVLCCVQVCVVLCRRQLTFGTALVRTFLPRLKVITVSEFLLNRNRPGSAVRDIELRKNEGQGML